MKIIVSYKKSFIPNEGDLKENLYNVIEVIKIDGLDLYVESKRVNKPTKKEVLNSGFISRVYKIEGDKVIVGQLMRDNSFKKSPYYD